jgi:Domain of unknown function (DUF3854)
MGVPDRSIGLVLKETLMKITEAAVSNHGGAVQASPDLPLDPDHLADLRRSGLTDTTIAAAGIRELMSVEFTARLGPRLAAEIVSAYVIPYPGADGFERIKLFPPVSTGNGTMRYHQAPGTAPRLYIPPLARAALADPTVPLHITEGEKKSLAADQAGLVCIGLGGLWNWLHDGQPIKDLGRIDWYRRPVILTPDSEVWTRPELRQPVYALGKDLQERGAVVFIEKLPAGPDGGKVGLDDFLLTSTVAELDALPKLPLNDPFFSKTEMWWTTWRARKAGTAQSSERGESAEPAEWPVLAPEALYGPVGHIVETIAPHSEADHVAILLHTLVAAGNLLGPGPHARVEQDAHPGRLNAILVGKSSKGRKGLSWSMPRAMLRAVDPTWTIASGLSSGEGLIYHVRDSVTTVDPDSGEVEVRDPGVSDKRVLVVETEFATVLTRMSRDGNTLSAVLRDAWDHGNLSTLTKNSPLKATGAHVSILGHITAEELVPLLSTVSMANGFGNRFLWACVRRARLLPEGEGVDSARLQPLTEALGKVVTAAKNIGQIRRDPEAAEFWRAVYPDLSRERDGLVGALLGRAEAQTLRLSVLYAVLDGSPLIRLAHLQAAVAVWGYCEASVPYLFAGRLGHPVADAILDALHRRGCLARTEISGLFSRHQSATQIEEALGMLERSGLAKRGTRQTGGRPEEYWQIT